MNTGVEKVRMEIAETKLGLEACRIVTERQREAAEALSEPARSRELGMIEASLMWIEKFGNSLGQIEAGVNASEGDETARS